MRHRRVGVVDSGFGPQHTRHMVSCQQFALGQNGCVIATPCTEDLTGHGSAVLDVILQHATTSVFAVAQVFNRNNRTSVEQVVAAIDWLVEQRVELINLSLGLRESREELRVACTRAHAQGILLVASSPAMGPAVYPAAYPEVIAVTSDGRCTAPGQCNRLRKGNAQFGAYGHGPHGHIGASMACAHFSGLWIYNTDHVSTLCSN